MQTRLSCFRRFRVYAFSPFSGFRRFPRFRRFRIFAFLRFRVHRLIPPVFAFSCFHMFSPGVFVLRSAMEWAASVHTLHMPKAVITFVFKVLQKFCFSTYLTHAQSFDNVRVHSATQWTASVNTLHMPKGVKTFVFKVLQKSFCFRYITYTCPKL